MPREVCTVRLSPRYLLDALFVLAGGFVSVIAFAFVLNSAKWTAFGVFTGVAVLAIAGAAMARRVDHKAGHGLIAVIALWSLIATLIFSGSALMWLILAGGIGVGVAALLDLAAHEMRTERVVHELEVTGKAPRPREEVRGGTSTRGGASSYEAT